MARCLARKQGQRGRTVRIAQLEARSSPSSSTQCSTRNQVSDNPERCPASPSIRASPTGIQGGIHSDVTLALRAEVVRPQPLSFATVGKLHYRDLVAVPSSQGPPHLDCHCRDALPSQTQQRFQPLLPVAAGRMAAGSYLDVPDRRPPSATIRAGEHFACREDSKSQALP